MPVNQEDGVSVYCRQRQPIEDRENSPLYKSVRELVNKYSHGGLVLDIGCNDLVASRDLSEQGFTVLGVDLDRTALTEARINAPQISLIQADAINLPIKKEAADVVLLLDILEHLSLPQARKLLLYFSQTTAKMIVSMPVISPFSISSNKELLEFVMAGQRPAMGLFDRTHQILTDQAGHRKLFKSGGMRIVEEFTTNKIESVSGEWKWKQEQLIDADTPNGKVLPGIRCRSYRMIIFGLIPRLVHPLDSSKRREVTDRLIAYQGLYVLEGQEV